MGHHRPWAGLVFEDVFYAYLDIVKTPIGERSMSTNTRRITIIISKDTHQALKLEAVRQETTVSDIVRALIDRWLQEQQEQEKPSP